MSGHSHWSSIKHKKGAADEKRSKAFSKISQLISVAAREGGGELNFNPKLKMAVEKARSFNMPADRIEKAIKKGTGEIEGMNLEEVTFEAYGPGGVAIIIEGITDNKNRSLGKIKEILNKNGGKLADEGSVRWMFERKGRISLSPEDKKDQIELLIIESGAEDFKEEEEFLNVYTKAEKLEEVKNNLEKNVEIDSFSLDWVPKETIEIGDKEKDKCQDLFESLDEEDMVQDIYSNLSD
jgi:YebC/PmpR family DNA-binding regulatory protein